MQPLSQIPFQIILILLTAKSKLKTLDKIDFLQLIYKLEFHVLRYPSHC